MTCGSIQKVYTVSIIKKLKPEKRHLIIEAAAGVFARKGFSGTAMADIAAGARIGKGTIYEYFASKEELFFSVFEWVAEQSGSAAMVDVSTLGGSVSKRLSRMSESIMKYFDEMKDFFSLVMEFWSASASSLMRDRFKDAFRNTYQEYRQLVSSLVQDGIDHGEFRQDIEPEAIAAALVGTWDALLLQGWFDESFDPAGTAGKYLPVLLNGMRMDKGIQD